MLNTMKVSSWLLYILNDPMENMDNSMENITMFVKTLGP
jgi:hypothetical protein